MSRYLTLLVTPLLAACVATGDYQASTAATPAAFADAGAATQAPAAQKWWLAFKDPVLDRLIATGLAQNLDVKQAVERVTEARAGVTGAGAAGLPQVQASGMAGRGDMTGAGAASLETGSLEAGWTLDLFSKVQSGRMAARARLDAAYASSEVARIVLTGAVAETYVDLRYYQERMALTRQSLQSRQKTRDMIQSSLESGAATKLDTLQADQLVAVAEAELPALEVGYAAALNRLATLTGQGTTAIAADLSRGAAQPVPRFRAQVGVPAEVIRKRPDIIAAERNLAAASAAVGVAKAELFPSLSLGGMIKSVSIGGGAASETWSFGPSLSLPIFAGGALKANLSASESRARQAHLAWQAAVLRAVEEVQTALAAYARDGRSMAAQSRLLGISKDTLDLARSSFEIGEGNFLAVLDAERMLLDSRGGLAAANRNRALNFIRLSVATAEGVGTN
jgi:multidrug efflux system outer membrane protein